MKVGRPSKTNPIDRIIGERIRKARQEKGYTQKELATMMGVTVDSVRGWENHRVMPNSEERFESLAVALDVDKMWLMNQDAKVGIDITKYPSLKEELLHSMTTDELLAEIKRRIEHGEN